MSAVDAWEEMQQEELRARKKENIRTASVTVDKELQALLRGKPAGKIQKKAKKKTTATKRKDAHELTEEDESSFQITRRIENQENEAAQDRAARESIPEEMMANPKLILRIIQRDINLVASEDIKQRKGALDRLKSLLCTTDGDVAFKRDALEDVFSEVQKPLLKRLADTSEKCRELAIEILTVFLRSCDDLGPILPYFYPALMDRSSDSFVIDFEANEVVRDVEAHEARKRGVAVSLPDAGAVYVHSVNEPSEEIRLSLCNMLGVVVHSLLSRDLHTMLGPYFHDTVMFFHSCAVDPYPTLRVEGLAWLKRLAKDVKLANTMHHYSTALTRSIMPSLRHRQSKVRVAALESIAALVACPHFAKQRGGGTDAIADLVGFREDNVIPICAFYQGETRLNYFGFVVTDESISVRLAFYNLVAQWLTTLLDRWDHAGRLLPFLLASLSDKSEDAQQIGLKTLTELGRQYEDENRDQVLEKRQYGVDGVQSIANYDSPLPAPWFKRPSIGTRLYVRQYARRFLFTVLKELVDWKSGTKENAVGLLLTMLVYLEEQVTMELHRVIQSLVTLVEDPQLSDKVLACAGILGRYVDPEAYLKLLLPSIDGESGTLTSLSEANWTIRTNSLAVLNAMIVQSKASRILPHFTNLVCVASRQDMLRADLEQNQFRVEHQSLLRGLVQTISSAGGRAAMDAHFLSTGRLSSLSFQYEQLLCLSVHLKDRKSFLELVESLGLNPVKTVSDHFNRNFLNNQATTGIIVLTFVKEFLPELHFDRAEGTTLLDMIKLILAQSHSLQGEALEALKKISCHPDIDRELFVSVVENVMSSSIQAADKNGEEVEANLLDAMESLLTDDLQRPPPL